MVMKMARPSKRAESSKFLFRKRVPTELQSIVGKKVIKLSLKTSDPAEAKIRFLQLSVDIEAQWQSLKRGPIELSHEQLVALSKQFYDKIITTAQFGNVDITDIKKKIGVSKFIDESSTKVIGGNTELYDNFMRHFSYPIDKEIDDFLFKKGLILKDNNRKMFKTAVIKSITQAQNVVIKRLVEHDYRPDPEISRFPEIDNSNITFNSVIYTPSAIYNAYKNENKPSASSIKRWQPIFKALDAEFNDVRDIDRDWAVRWKDSLLEKGLSTVTVADVYLAATKAVMSWAVANNKIKSNPFEGVIVRKRRTKKVRENYYSESEAKIILQAAMNRESSRSGQVMKDAYFWVPFLLAYTGARVGEIAQLRKKDVFLQDDIWIINITPEAGSVKTGTFRIVPVHNELIKLGFIEFVKNCDRQTLFYNPDRRRSESLENPQHKKVGERIAEWIKKILPSAAGISPNHAWRHRFKTIARNVDMDGEARDYLQGHATGTEASKYGAHTARPLKREIDKLPVITLN